MMSTRVPEDTRSKIRRLHREEGLTLIQLAERFSLDTSTIRLIIREQGQKYERPTLSSKQDKEALKNANIPAAIPAPYNWGSRSRGFQKSKKSTTGV